jgi:uncharacterized membrane protein
MCRPAATSLSARPRTPPLPTRRAFRWTASAGYAPVVPAQSIAMGISADGTTLVGHRSTSASFWAKAIKWSEGSGLVELLPLPGDVESEALDTTADGSVVVGSSFGLTGPQSATIWDEQNVAWDLQQLLAEQYGLHLAGWQLQTCTAITPDGMTIVGNGLNPQGQQEGWVISIPEPSAAAAVLMAAFAVRRRLRRTSSERRRSSGPQAARSPAVGDSAR